MKRFFAIVVAAAVAGSVLTAAPAQADHARPGDHVFGHRCRTDANRVSIENTVAALIDTARVPGAVCEIDVVRISDGTVIVWHDGTWRRVADPDTLPSGIDPGDSVRAATWAQVRQIRTRGGEPVARFEDMIDAAGAYDITLAAELRNPIPRPAWWVRYAAEQGANVSYYMDVQDNCSTRKVDGFRAAGATIGLKLISGCAMTPAQIQATGASFTQELSFRIPGDAYLAEMNRRGISVGVLDRGMTEELAESLVARGVSRVLLDQPRIALTWFS